MEARVSIVRGEGRSENIYRALTLIRDEIEPLIKGRVVIKPNFLSPHFALASTQGGAVEGVVRFLKEFDGVDEILVAEGCVAFPLAIRNFGYEDLKGCHRVRFVDILNEREFREIDLLTVRGERNRAGLWEGAFQSDCLISVAVPKTHDFVVMTGAIKNMMGFLRGQDRVKMHGGHGIPDPIFPLLNGMRRVLTRSDILFGIARRGVHLMRNGHNLLMNLRDRKGEWLSERYLISVLTLIKNLLILAGTLPPGISVIDGWEGMEGNGPGGGTPVKLGLALAGRDPLLTDIVTAAIMGFDPLDVGYLYGLLLARGEDAIAEFSIEEMEKRVVGTPLKGVVTPFIPSPKQGGQLRWKKRRGEIDAFVSSLKGGRHG